LKALEKEVKKQKDKAELMEAMYEERALMVKKIEVQLEEDKVNLSRSLEYIQRQDRRIIQLKSIIDGAINKLKVANLGDPKAFDKK